MATLFKRRRNKATHVERVRERRHEGFLRYANFRWAKISGGLCLLIIVSYALIDVTPRPNGGSWYGYPGFCRSAYRYFFAPGFRVSLLGFRVARVQAE